MSERKSDGRALLDLTIVAAEPPSTVTVMVTLLLLAAPTPHAPPAPPAPPPSPSNQQEADLLGLGAPGRGLELLDLWGNRLSCKRASHEAGIDICDATTATYLAKVLHDPGPSSVNGDICRPSLLITCVVTTW